MDIHSIYMFWLPVIVVVGGIVALVSWVSSLRTSQAKAGFPIHLGWLAGFALGLPLLQLGVLLAIGGVTLILWGAVSALVVVALLVAGVVLIATKRPREGIAALASLPFAIGMDLLLPELLESAGYRIPFGS